MGACHCKKSKDGQTQSAKVKIGGGEAGTCTWKVLKGEK